MPKTNKWSVNSDNANIAAPAQGNSSDFEKCIRELNKHNADYYTKTNDDGTVQIVCYSPYYSYDNEHNKLNTTCYVYNWCDTYTIDGEFIKHEVYECAYTTELDYTL